jgi:hypothetical protein
MMSHLLVLLGWMCLTAGPAHAGDGSGNAVDFTLPRLGGGAVSLSDFEVSYPILRVDVYDPPQPFGSPRALPTTILLDQQGRSAKTFMGPVTRQAIEQFIAAKAASPQVSQFN